MKIAYLINGMFNSAGRERVVANKASFLTQRGHEITIITTDQKDRAYYYDIPAEVKTVDLGINNDEYAGLPIYQKVCQFLKNNSLFKTRLKAYLKNNPHDVIVTLEDRFIPALFSIVPDNIVIVAENHFNQFAFAELGKSVKRNLIQRIVYSIRSNYVKERYYKKLDAYVLLTHEDFGYWKGSKKNVFVIPNSVAYDKNKKAELNNKIVIAVGRLSYQKGFERLIETWKYVTLQCPDWVLNIYGNGEDKEKLLDLIAKLGLKESINIMPPTSEIEDRLINSSIYALSSRFEGLPMVLLEAMSLGLPIVSYNCKTGPKDIIKNGYNGFLVNEGEKKILADNIVALIKNEDLRKNIGHNAKVEAAKYSHEVIAQEWEELFYKLIKEKHDK